MGVLGQRQQLVRQQQWADDLVTCVRRVGGADGAHWSSSSEFGAMLVPKGRLVLKWLKNAEQQAGLISQANTGATLYGAS